MKKIISLILILSIIFTLSSINVFATDIIDWDTLSQECGIGVEELKSAYSTMSFDEFLAATDYAKNMMNEYTNYPVNTNISTTYAAMGDNVWRNYRNAMRKGSVLITSESYFAGFQHGHAAIVSDISNETASDALERVIYIVEHPGSTTNSGLSWRVLLSNNATAYWRKTLNSAVFSSASANTYAMNIAGNKSRTKIDLPYSPLPNKDNRLVVNCSSLVYQCYDDAGIDISNGSSVTVLPINIAQDSDLTIVAEYGNLPWR